MTTSDSQPLISSCFFSYNSADTLPDAIASIYDNATRDFEVVVVDDGSTDNTEAIVRRLRLPNLRYVRKDHSGRPDSRNRCIAEARGDYVLWLGADDRLNKGVLDAYIDFLIRFPEAGVLYGSTLLTDLNLKPVKMVEYEDWTGRPEDVPAGMIFRNGVPDTGTLVKKCLYEQYGGYDLSFPRAQDYEWYVRVAGQVEFRHIGLCTAIWRRSCNATRQKGVEPMHGYRVVEGLLERYPLQRLVPNAGWGEAPDNQAEAVARLLVAERFLNLGAQESAMKQIRLVLKLKPGEQCMQVAMQLLEVIDQRQASQNPGATED